MTYDKNPFGQDALIRRVKTTGDDFIRVTIYDKHKPRYSEYIIVLVSVDQYLDFYAIMMLGK